jgi:MoaA/NifB/PqqE/SkfB family radical SAM enzyme
MADSVSLSMLSHSQDLFRSVLPNLPADAVERALSWLRREGPYPAPISVHLNLTLRCTARCVHCNQWAWPAHTELSFEQISDLIRVFRTWNVRTVTLAGGNPLLHHDFVPMLELAHGNGLQVGVVTEGLNLTTEMVQAIGRLTSWVRFSLDGPTATITCASLSTAAWAL